MYHKRLHCLAALIGGLLVIVSGMAGAGLIGQYKLDEISGTIASDSSGKGNNGTLTTISGAPAWTTGHLGGALQFDNAGTPNTYITLPAANMGMTFTVGSVAFWMNAPTAYGTAIRTMFWAGDSTLGNGFGPDNELHVHIEGTVANVWRGGELSYFILANPNLAIHSDPNKGASGNVPVNPKLVNDSQWHHVVATWDGPAGTAKLYLDGSLLSQGAYTSTNFQLTYMYIGTMANGVGQAAGTGRKYTGLIDDFQIYNHALTSAEVPIAMLGGVPLGPATSPQPADAATDVLRGTTLQWKPGPFAATHDVYFGTQAADVNSADRTHPMGVLLKQAQDVNTFNAPNLQLGQTYYWRVDEVNAPPSTKIFKGNMWSFTVEPVANPITGVTATASSTASGYSAQYTVDGSGLTGDLAAIDTTTTEWLSVTSPTTPTWIEYDLGAVYKVSEMWVWNSNYQFEWALNFGLKSVTIQYSANGTDWTKLGDYQFAQGPSASNYAHNTTVNFTGVAARKVRITANSNYGGKQYGLSEVRFYSIPVLARQPSPTTGATGIAPDVTLGWRAGREAVSHSVYVGTDPNVLTLAGTSATNSFAPANLSLGTKYYWRVDEVNTATTPSTWAGPVWNFATNPFIVVDDMESYNDSTNQIFNVWVDGYGTTTNGAVVGLTTSVAGTFGSTTIFHAGKQSMPLAYNNAGSITNSEATRTFDSIQDWTKNGVKTLTLYFYGQAGNKTTVPFWVRLTDQSNKTAKVTFGAAGEDTLVLADPAWATWNIPLSGFTGITLSKIKSMTIGLGNGTGSGTLYIDDIRLYPPTTTTTVTPALVGWWKLDNDVKDSSGAGNNGTIVGTPTYVAAGKIGASLKLNGTTDYVDCGNAASLNISDVITCSAWIKPASLANTAYQTFISKGDNAYVLAQTNANLLQMSIYDTGAWYQANSVAVTTAFNGSWHHVAGTFDGTEIRLYIDGKMASSALRVGAINIDTYVLSIGRNSQQASRLFNGEMDDVRIYHGVLSTSDIVKLANP